MIFAGTQYFPSSMFCVEFLTARWQVNGEGIVPDTLKELLLCNKIILHTIIHGRGFLTKKLFFCFIILVSWAVGAFV
jgi:hypothetical protein